MDQSELTELPGIGLVSVILGERATSEFLAGVRAEFLDGVRLESGTLGEGENSEFLTEL